MNDDAVFCFFELGAPEDNDASADISRGSVSEFELEGSDEPRSLVK